MSQKGNRASPGRDYLNNEASFIENNDDMPVPVPHKNEAESLNKKRTPEEEEEEPEYVKQLRAQLAEVTAKYETLKAHHMARFGNFESNSTALEAIKAQAIINHKNAQRLKAIVTDVSAIRDRVIATLLFSLLHAEGTVLMKALPHKFPEDCYKEYLYFQANTFSFTPDDWAALKANQDYCDLMQIEQLPVIQTFTRDFASFAWFSDEISWKGVQMHLDYLEMEGGVSREVWEKLKAAFDVLSQSELIERLNKDYWDIVKRNRRYGRVD